MPAARDVACPSTQRGLADEGDPVGQVGLGEDVGQVDGPGDDDDRADLGGQGRADGVDDEGPASHRRQQLVGRTGEPVTLPRRQDHHRDPQRPVGRSHRAILADPADLE